MSTSRKTRWLIASAVAFILVITAPLMIRGWRQKRSFDVAINEYLADVQRGDYRAAYERSGEEFRTATPYDGFVHAHEALIASNGKLIHAEQGRTVVEGRGSPTVWAGVAHVKMRFERASQVLIYEFHNDGGHWKLYGFRASKYQ